MGFRKPFVIGGIAAVALLGGWMGAFSLGAEETEFEADKGPQEIDVSGYPAPLQKSYGLFQQRCSQCHNLARPVNSAYVLPDEWERYIKRMLRKPGSEMTSGEAKELYEFLVYDASQRKKQLLAEKLNGLPKEEKDAAENKIRQIAEKYRR